MAQSNHPDLDNLTDDQILDLRFSELGLRIEGTFLEDAIKALYGELEARGLVFRPSCYLGDEWFSPDGSPTVALPFYLAHPRLMQIEKKMMLEIEGGESPAATLKLLRHECGHSLCHAYQLVRRRDWRRVFGSPKTPYRDYYRIHPYSRNFVRHLENWYAQSHPEEDFAETFAVWLAPGDAWRQAYQGWPALRKLEFVDALMKDLGGRTAPVTKPDYSYSVSRMRKRLRRHYQERHRLYAEDDPGFFDRDLTRIFAKREAHPEGAPAPSFLARHRKALLAQVSHFTRERKVIVNRLLTRLSTRSRELKLRVPPDEATALVALASLLAALSTHYLFTGRFKKDDHAPIA